MTWELPLALTSFDTVTLILLMSNFLIFVAVGFWPKRKRD